jgi:hypothetical protein
MKLSRTDVGALTAVAVSGAIGLALFGPRMWAGDSVVTLDLKSEWTTESTATSDGESTVIIKKKIRREDGSEEIVVTVETDGDETHERRIRVDASEDGELHIEGVDGEGEHFEWTSDEESSEHARVRTRVIRGGEGEHSSEEGENVFMLRTSEGLEPLIYMDGELVDRSVMEELNPDQIERIEVLKGDAAIEMYGPEAVAGVVQIFTKDGSGSQ